MELWKRIPGSLVLLILCAGLTVGLCGCFSTIHPPRGGPYSRENGYRHYDHSPAKRVAIVLVDKNGKIQSIEPYALHANRKDTVEWYVAEGFRLEIEFKETPGKPANPDCSSSKKCKLRPDVDSGVYEYGIKVFRGREQTDIEDPELVVEH